MADQFNLQKMQTWNKAGVGRQLTLQWHHLDWKNGPRAPPLAQW